MNLTRVVRVGAVTLLVGILAIIAVLFITHPPRPSQLPKKTEKITQEKIEKKEQVEHFEFKGEKGSLKIRADKHYGGKGNWDHLEGNVEIILLKKREGKDVFLYGDKAVYNREGNHFRLLDNVRVKFKDLLIESNVLNYNSKKDSFWSYRGVRLSSERLKCSAQRIDYFVNKEKVELGKKVQLQIKPNLETSFPLVAKGSKFEYSRKERRGIMEGGVQLFHGESRGFADILEFDLFPDEENIKVVFFKGKVKATLVSEEEKDISSKSQSDLFSQSVRREIEAEEIELSAFQNLPKINSVKGKGNCSFKFISSSGSFTQFKAERIKFAFNQDGSLKEFHAITNARMADQGENPEERRLVVGETMVIKDKTDVLQIKGKEQFDARITYANSEIIAGKIDIFFDSNNLEAREGVKIILKSQNEKNKPIGFFSKEKPVFIITKEMRYSEEQKRFNFTEDIKIWQEKKILLAEEVTLSEETGEIICTGKVKSVFPHKPEEKKEEENVEISANNMKFKPEENLIFYEEKCSLKVKNADLQAQTISVYLKEKRGDVKEIVAHGEVVIVQNQSQGKGEEAKYDPDKETIVLLGNPVMTDKDKGVTKGDKLTFYIADGRIVVENKEKKRSVTVVKS